MLLLSIFKIDSTSNKLNSCDTTKHTKLLGSCCNVPRNDQYSKACRQSLLSKANRTTNNADTRNLKSDKVALHACMAECVFKKNGFLYSNGTVNLSVMQRSLEQRYKKDAALAKLVAKSLNSCADYAKTRTKQFEWLHAKDNCDYYPATLLACIMEQVYQNCPASLWKNTEDCAAMKKFLIACDDVKKTRK
ncbi:Odorant-binding protein 93a [Drosophila mojavensis]|uniref:Odorant-binding protein 93a n=2 Tax=Drosophila mojavensis TaxID=7230 RepID=B4KCB9_DROMO|nr:Odorant-binding protein 93a [Drosophila mojavensis]